MQGLGLGLGLGLGGGRWNGGKMDCMVLRYWSGSFWYGMEMNLSREGRCVGCGDDFSLEHWMRGCGCTHNWRLRWQTGDWRVSCAGGCCGYGGARKSVLAEVLSELSVREWRLR